MNAKLKSMHTGVRPKRTVKRGNERCKVCDYLCLGDVFGSKTTGREFSINYKINCNSNAALLLHCELCSVDYVGSTSMKRRLRFMNHESCLKAHASLLLSNKD